MSRLCVLNEKKTCDNCYECDMCDLNSQKICDNCAQCIEKADYNSIEVDDIIVD
ncbi:putative ATP-dependent serine protease [Desulfitispora alkaliphila]